MLSVLINTLNEESNIRTCLESVKWADEIILVDMESEDRTIDIAREYSCNIFLHPRVGYVEPAREFALSKSTGDWILEIDADEILTIGLRQILMELIASDKYDAVEIPRKNYFFGEEMKGTGWGPLQDTHVRLFKRGVKRYSSRIHSGAKLSDDVRVYRIQEPDYCYIHFNYMDVEHFINKLNRYTTIEAENLFDDLQRFSVKKAMFGALKEALKRYIILKGYRDGFLGISLTILMITYRITSYLKLRYMYKYRSKNFSSSVVEGYSVLANTELEKHRMFDDPR